MIDIPTLFVDGACKGNPGPGAWCAIVKYNGQEVEISDKCSDTTNNREEIKGFLVVLEYFMLNTQIREFNVVTDSMYLIYGIRNWKQWTRKKNMPNWDLWHQWWQIAEDYHPTIHTHWVKGHSGHVENERANEIAEELAGSVDKKEHEVYER